MKNVDLQFFPGWIRKSVTFTIDDGNITLDKKFMSYVGPGGFKGTFNLTTPLRYTAESREAQYEFYRGFYTGYGIANHCRYHAYPFTPERQINLKNEIFDKASASREYAYLTDEKGLYRIYTYSWTYLADDDKYMECVDSCQRELEEIFGKGKIKGYIWPCGEQNNPAVFERLKAYGFQSIRKTGCVEDRTGFALPADRTRWSYNANYTDLNEVGSKYDSLPDDGTLKFFCFGVHSHDFENHNCWDVLERFVADFGNRPADFWYASVGDIMDYEDAVKAVNVSETEITNRSNINLYIKIDGEQAVLPAHSSISLI